MGKGKEITLLGHSISLGSDTKNTIVKTSGDTNDDHRSEGDGKSWITRDVFFLHTQTTTLKVTLESGKVLSNSVLILPCALADLGCDTSSLDPYSYVWDYPDNYAISNLWTEEVNVVKQGNSITLSVELIPALNLFSRWRTSLKNIAESQHLFTL